MGRKEKLESIPLKSIKIDDSIWSPYIRLVRSEIIPYQWKALNDTLKGTVPSHSINNFRIAAGEKAGTFEGAVFQDTDVAKWLEAVAYSLETNPDPKLEKMADETIALIGRAQQKDGYLDTYFIIKEPDRRWTNLKEGHELYTAGHMIEAATAYYQATGKREFLEIVCRLADLICRVFGSGEGQCHGYPGHEEIELALVRLFYATGIRRYLEMAKYFIDVRGVGENYFLEEEKNPLFQPIWAEPGTYDPAYSQSHLPVRKQKTAEGHAVRAVYLYCAMADLAYEYNDKELFAACRRLWKDMTCRRMYITGSIGSSALNERFTTDYDLPNDRNYSESCASIGLSQFGKRMAMITRDASYMDVVEKALYNTVLAGIAETGNRFFYVNPLEVWPENCLPHTSMEHVKPVRQKWFGVACCPPNIARTLASLGQYLIFADKAEGCAYINIYAAGTYEAETEQGRLVIAEEGTFPYDGRMKFHVKTDGGSPRSGKKMSLALRIPSYAESFEVFRNNEKAVGCPVRRGYIFIKNLEKSEEIEIRAAIPAQFVHANPQVRADEGKIALVKGPLVYCLEEIDNGKNLSSILAKGNQKVEEKRSSGKADGMQLKFNGVSIDPSEWKEDELYRPGNVRLKERELTAVPYFRWGNRKAGEMTVWIKELLR